MSVPAARIIETLRVFTPLGVAFHDLVSDARVTDGLRVDARPAGGGRVVAAFQTKSGAYAFRALAGMRAIELPESDVPASTPTGRDFDITVVDLRGRFVDMVLRVPVPTLGLVSQADLGLAGAVEQSVPLDDLPIYLFSSPARLLPGHIAVVRAQLVDDITGAPAASARLEVVVGPAGPQQHRYSGLANAAGAVAVPLPYPRFANAPAVLASVPPPGTRGEPTADRQWLLTVLAHYEPDVLVYPPGLPTPTLDTVLAQRPGELWATTGGPAQASLEATLRYGTELVLRTAGDAQSRLLIRAAP